MSNTSSNNNNSNNVILVILALSILQYSSHGFSSTSTPFQKRRALFNNNNNIKNVNDPLFVSKKTTKTTFTMLASTPNNQDESEASTKEEEAVAVDDDAFVAEEDTTNDNDKKKKKKKFVIVGGGWGGWGAAKALCQSGIDAEIILMDALPDPTGSTPYLSKSGKPVEAGTRGFWKDYPNIYALCDELHLDQSEIFTPYLNSSFYSPDGLEATAPVFADVDSVQLFPNIAPFSIPSNLPSPLGQVIATFPLFERIPLQDRASMVGLLLATVDCIGNSDNTELQAKYDKMSAHELFLRFGLSDRLVRDFIKPTLLVGLFKPPEELSALVVMELLYFYALAHQDSFDVRWIKNGTVSDSLLEPLSRNLMTTPEYNLQVLGNCRVGEIKLETYNNDDSKNRKLLKASSLSYSTMDFKTGTIQEGSLEDVDGLILALGVKGMKAVVGASPDLAKLNVFAQAATLQGIDVISTRLWLDRNITSTLTPANVFSRFDALRGAGGTFFMLDQLQKDALGSLWGQDEIEGSVVAADFYNAGALMNLPDEEIVNILMKELLPSAVTEFADAKVVDSWVGKYAGSVSWFSPGSFDKRPPLEGAGRNLLPNVKCAGDWVRMGEREHGAKGLCQERAFVSGLEAANALLESIAKKDESSFTKATVLPVRDDEIQFKVASKLNQGIMQFIPRFWVRGD